MDVTTTAQTFQGVASALSGVGLSGLVEFLIAAVCGALLAPTVQDWLEGHIASVTGGAWGAILKLVGPELFSLAASGLGSLSLKFFGVAISPADAGAAWLAMLAMMRANNWQGWTWHMPPPPSTNQVKVLLLAIGLALLSSHAQAKNLYDVNLGLMTGMNNYAFSSAGTLVPQNSGLAGGEVTTSLGHLENGKYQPDLIQVSELALDAHSGSEWLNAGLGAGFVIPATHVPVCLLVNWDLGSGQPLPYIGFIATLPLDGLDFPFSL